MHLAEDGSAGTRLAPIDGGSCRFRSEPSSVGAGPAGGPSRPGRCGMTAELLVEEVVKRSARRARCLAKCLNGPLRFGDVLAGASDGTRDVPVYLEVVMIERYPGVVVDELEPNFGALLEFRGRLPSSLQPGWRLRSR